MSVLLAASSIDMALMLLISRDNGSSELQTEIKKSVWPFDLKFLGFPVNLTVAFKRLNCTKMVRLAEMDKIIKLKDKADGMQ